MVFLNLVLFFAFFCISSQVSCLGRLRDPPARSSCYLEFPNECKKELLDLQMSCGGKDVQWRRNAGKCGICGDNYSDPTPRKYERGGSGYTGFIVRTYKMNQIINVKVELKVFRNKWFEFRLCKADDLYAQGNDATQECLDKYRLQDTLGNTMFVIYNSISNYNFNLTLPVNLTCNRCVLQWKYSTGFNNTEFYGCSDVRILNDYQYSKCPNGDGHYVDKKFDCRVFYTCLYTGTDNFLLNEHLCPENQRFDLSLKACNYANRVTC